MWAHNQNDIKQNENALCSVHGVLQCKGKLYRTMIRA